MIRHRAAPRQSANYVSPAADRFAALLAADQQPRPDRFRLPATRAELDALSYTDRCRVYAEDRTLYDRLTGRTA